MAQAASFTSSEPGSDLGRFSPPGSSTFDLLLTDAPDDLLVYGAPNEQLSALLKEAPCDVALLASRNAMTEGPVLVPFGGADHDWAAVELGAWLAHAAGVPLRLAGTAAVPERGKRDASRLLSARRARRPAGARASRPSHCLTPPGEDGMLEAEPRRRPRGRGAVVTVAPGGPGSSPPARARSDRAHAVRPSRSPPRRPSFARRPDPLHLVID